MSLARVRAHAALRMLEGLGPISVPFEDVVEAP
jgi:hypothetical protein